MVLIMTSLISCGSNDVKKATEFMNAGMYPQAIELLKKRVNEKPSDGEAHFQLGICYINTQLFSKANERFASAVKIKTDYGFKIGEEYKIAGVNSINKRNIKEASQFFEMATKYQPNLSKEIADLLFSKGESLLSKGKKFYKYFQLAEIYDPTLNEKICDTFYNAGKGSSGSKKAEYFDHSTKFCNKYFSEISVFLSSYYFDKGKNSHGKNRVSYFRKSLKIGNDYLASIKKYLLTDANKIEKAGNRKTFLKTLSGIVTNKEILDSSVEYFSKILKNHVGKEVKPIKVVINKNEWVKGSNKKITGRDCVYCLSTTPEFQVKMGKYTETNKANIYQYSGGYYPQAGYKSGKIFYFKEKNGKPGTIYYWVFKCQ